MLFLNLEVESLKASFFDLQIIVEFVLGDLAEILLVISVVELLLFLLQQELSAIQLLLSNHDLLLSGLDILFVLEQ